jgi:hypothetical protein
MQLKVEMDSRYMDKLYGLTDAEIAEKCRHLCECFLNRRELRLPYTEVTVISEINDFE